MKWNSDVKAYIEFFKDGCPTYLRPVRCLGCGFQGIIHRHGHYTRMVVTLCNEYTIIIFRFKCPDCGETYSLKPTFIGSNRQATWDVEESIVQRNETGMPLAELAKNFLPPAGPYSEKTFWRWTNIWKQRIETIHDFVFNEVLNKIPNLAIPVGKGKPQTTKEWLSYLWYKWKDAFLSQEDTGFFHWLYRMYNFDSIPYFTKL